MVRRRLSFVHLLIALAVEGAFAAASADALGSSANCNPRVYGATGDGVSKDTAAIQKAIDVCEGQGGGTVRLIAGTYLSAPIVLKSKITLQLDKGATLLGSSDYEDYPPKTEFRKPGRQSLVSATDASNVAIRGEGVIDGAGKAWWQKKGVVEDVRVRPRLVVFDHCKHVLVEGITIQNSPDWQLVPYYSDDVTIRNIKVLAPANSPNTDAIDPFSSSNVRIDHVVADVGDDNIAIKSGMAGSPGPDEPSHDITITDCTFLHGHGLSVGSELAGGAKDIRAERIHFEGTSNGIRVKSNRDRGGDVGPLFFRDIDMKDVKTALNIYEYSAMETRLTQKAPSPDGEVAQPVTRLTPHFHDITIENVTAQGGLSAGEILGLPEASVTGVVLHNVRISAQYGLTIHYAELSGTGVVVEASNGQPITKLMGARVSLR